MFAATRVRHSLPTLCACGLALLVSAPAAAQDSAFLACEQFSDRGQRIACLEDALEAATAREEAAPAVSPAAPPAPSAPAAPLADSSRSSAPATASTPPPARAPEPAAAAEGGEEGPSLLDRIRKFGRDDSATISTDAEGQERLHDTIAKLEKRREAWIVTLASGQVWMQDYPRSLNLREGDPITIYQAGIGNGYRLSTDRLSGFIRVKRVR